MAEGNGNVEQGKQLKPIDEVRHMLVEKMEGQFKMVLPPHVSPEKFIRVLLTAAQDEPRLIEDRASFYSAALKCATDGLIPDKREAAIVLFGGKAQYLPMIAGVLKKVRNSGELESITAHVVYDNDEFEYELGDNERIVHRPNLTGERGKPKLAYAIAKTKDGGVYREIMSEAQIDDVRKVSRAKDSGPWAGAFADEMRRKTVLRRLAKRLPMSTDLEQVIRRDDELYDFNQPQPGQPTAAPKKAGKGRSRMETIVDAETQEIAQETEPKKPTKPKQETPL